MSKKIHELEARIERLETLIIQLLWERDLGSRLVWLEHKVSEFLSEELSDVAYYNLNKFKSERLSERIERLRREDI